MPEGPEIRREADALAAALAGRPLTAVWFAFDRLKGYEAELAGRTVEAVEARGKALLTRLGGLTLYSHNQLYGRWAVTGAGARPESRRSLRVALHGPDASAWLFSASEIDVLDAAGLAGQPYLNRLGPEVLDPATTEETVTARLADPACRRRQLGALLTDQGFLAGLGNYLRCEVLHVTGLHPARRPMDLDPAELTALAGACLALPRQSYETGGVTNDPERAAALRQAGHPFEAYRFRVYRRAGQPCYRCGTPIEKHRLNSQPTYLCPACQPPPA
ncbi:MAG TPA: endonuclease VIII [Gammaproteobacteria bacterium]|nr:endonuclease VIII [Gammaproteobacteria bacterium]